MFWHVVEADGHVVAAVAHSERAGEIDVERLIVDPDWHRQGLARRVVTALPAGPATVSTGRDNQPARRLSESLRFRHVRDEEVPPGLWVSTYRRPDSTRTHLPLIARCGESTGGVRTRGSGGLIARRRFLGRRRGLRRH
ncbi:MAG: GNAT family N-acetyltransferase [Dermatophilaceae bacterium]